MDAYPALDISEYQAPQPPQHVQAPEQPFDSTDFWSKKAPEQAPEQAFDSSEFWAKEQEADFDSTPFWRRDDDEDVVEPARKAHLKTKGMHRGYGNEQNDASFRIADMAVPTAEAANKEWGTAARAEDAFVSKLRTRYLTKREQAALNLSASGATEAEQAMGLGLANQDRAVRGPGTVPGLEDQEPERDVRLRTADGRLADTSKASGNLGLAQPGAHTFVQSPGGVFRAGDPWALRRDEHLTKSNLEKPKADAFATDEAHDDAMAVYQDKKQREIGLALINHSSLAAVPNLDKTPRNGVPARPMTDGDVAAAGEVKATMGHLDQLSDRSGHYEPDNAMTGQALRSFKKMGVDLYDTTVKLEHKPDLHPNQMRRAPMYASAREFLAASQDAKSDQDEGNAGVNEPQRIMESRRDHMKWDLANAFSARQQRVPAAGIADPRAQVPLLTTNYEERMEMASRKQLAPVAAPAKRSNVSSLMSLFQGYAA